MIRFREDTWTRLVQEVQQSEGKCSIKTMKAVFGHVRQSMSDYAANIIVPKPLDQDDNEDGDTISLGEWMETEWNLDLIVTDIQLMTRHDLTIFRTKNPEENDGEVNDAACDKGEEEIVR
jgi:hypothetical protein